MNRFKQILIVIINSKHISLILLFLVAFLFRLILVFFHYPDRIAPDGTGYFTIAVNIIQGNGYSNSFSEPYVPNFFREPGYSFFLASGLGLFKLAGGNVEYLCYNDNLIFTTIPDSIVFLRIWQALFDSIGVLIFFKLLNLIIQRKYSFLFALILAVYFPIAIYCTYILRESFVSFLFLLMTYYMARLLISPKKKYLLLFSIFSAISILTFQVYAVIPFYFLFFVYLYSNNLKFSFVKTIYCSIIITSITLPWLCFVYSYYPDIRIAKTIGCSLTHELLKYNGSLRKLQYYNGPQESKIDFQWGQTSNTQFERSFNGYYKSKTDSINKLINESVFAKRKIIELATSLRKTVFFNKIAPMNSREAIRKRPFFYGPIIMLTFFVGIIGFIGIYIYYKKLFIISFSAFLHITLFFVIGSEYRRSLPAQHFILLTCCLLLASSFLLKFRKISFFHTKNLIFKNCIQ